MKRRAPSPRLHLQELEIAAAALSRARRGADQAYARESAAEDRLHDVHGFLHLALDRTRREDLSDEQREVAARLLRELADVLGYPMGEPSAFDVQMWLEADGGPPPEAAALRETKALP